MTALIARCLPLIALSLVLVSGAQADPVSSEARVIVKLRSGSALVTGAQPATVPMQRLGARLGLSLQDGRTLNTRTHVATAIGMSSQALANKLAAQGDVEYAVVDHWRQAASVTPNDPLYADSSITPNPYVAVGQWYLKAPDSTLVSAINAPAAWGITTGRSSVTVAVLDTGVRFDHPDLRDKLLPGYNLISSGVIAGNGVGRTNDASDLGDWLTSAEIAAHPEVYSGVTNPCQVQATSSWHGTQVAGIIGAASGNGVGMASVAGGAAILPVRVLGKCGGYDSDIMAGMLWAGGVSVDSLPAPRQTARVLNLSLGGKDTCSPTYAEVVAQLAARGVVVVAAAGNSLGEAVSTPGNCPGVIAVGGVRHAGTKVGYSALGPEVTISAPSGNCLTASGSCIYPILTTTNRGATTPVSDIANGSTYTGSGSTDASYGTSFSAPQVSGAVALMLSVRPELSPAEVAQILKNTARPFPTTGGTAGTGQCQAPSTTQQAECYCTTTTCGAGMLDVGRAVAAALVQPVAVAAVSPVAPQPAQVLNLSGSLAAPAGGVTAASYAWELVDSGGIVTLPADATTPVITVTPSGAGSFVARLTIIDSLGTAHTTDLSVTVAAPPAFAVAPSPSTLGTPNSGKSGGGGGAVDGAGLLALLAFGALASVLRARGAGRPAPDPR